MVFGFGEDQKEESSMFGGEEKEPSLMESIMGKKKQKSIKDMIPFFKEDPCCADMCPKLTYKQRVMGFFACAGCGWLLSFMGTLLLVGSGMPPSDSAVRTFAILYVIGNIITLCATGFLLTPKSQWSKMWDETRRYTTAFYLTMLIVVFALAVTKQNVWLVLGMLVIEIMAAIWYSLSYIPFGRKIAIGCCKKICCKCEDSN